jgi:hypothetical protein
MGCSSHCRAVDLARNGLEEHDGHVLQKKGNADGADQGRDAGRVAQWTVGDAIDQDADARDGDDRNDHGHGPGQVKKGDAPEHEIGPEHEDFAVREVDQPQDAVDHGVADGDERVEAAQGQAVQEVLDESCQIHGRSLSEYSGRGRPLPLALHKRTIRVD